MANTEIRRTTGSTPTNAKKFTVSLWFKLSKIGSANGLFGWRENSNDGNNNLFVRIATGGTFDIYFTSNNGNDTHIALVTNRLFRDCNSWYHAVISVDSTQGTSSNRVKLYINGVQETSFSSSTYPAADRTFFSNDVQINFGKTKSTTGSDTYLEGIESHIHFTDGYAYAASDFGETDSTTGEWKIKTSPSVTYGTNGFFWLKDSIATTDHSPNSNTFSVGNGTLTKTEDCPSNVFATLNPLMRNNSMGSFANGNNTYSVDATFWRTAFSSLGISSGKVYCEMKWVSGSNMMFGVFSLDEKNKQKNVGYIGDGNLGNRGVGLAQGGDYYINGNNFTYTGGSNTSWTTGDIIQIALDRDNNKVYFGKNGTWMGSGDPTSGSTGTGAISFSTEGHESWGFGTSVYESNSTMNFGNGYFGTTAVSSAGTNASGNGIFEYDVPTGYTALSTKGLNL